MTTDARSSARRIFASVAILGFVLGGAAAGWRAVDDEAGTYASVFPKQVIDLRLGGPRGVDGFLRGDNLAPGDRIPGVLVLSTKEPLELGLADLDVGVALDLRGTYGLHRLDEALVVSRLAYGVDDLLSGADGGRDASDQLDVDNDGIVTLRELAAGVDDLPPPSPARRGGTGLSIELLFQPRRDATSSDLGGQALDVRFTFHLADALGPDA